jgi:hypothetical protein
MRVFGINYFVFCFLVLTLVLFFTKQMRDEGFFGMSPGVMDQLRSTSVPTLQGEGFFGMSPGTLDQLQSTSVPSCSSSLPPMNTSMMNPMSTPLNSIIQGNLTKKGIMDMTEVSRKNAGFYALI